MTDIQCILHIGGVKMDCTDYQEAYYFLFNSISDLITKLEDLQKKAEEMIIDEDIKLKIEKWPPEN